MKSFKQYITENEVSKAFNSFVEKVITSNSVEPKAANGFLTQEYNYQGIIYRAIFVNDAEIENFKDNDGTFNNKSVSQYLKGKLNPNRFVFFSKSLEGLKSFIKTPGIFKLRADMMGIVFSIKAPASIDLEKYDGQNLQVKERLAKTHEVLSFEDMTVSKIEGLYYLPTKGTDWVLETDLKSVNIEQAPEPEEEFKPVTPPSQEQLDALDKGQQK